MSRHYDKGELGASHLHPYSVFLARLSFTCAASTNYGGHLPPQPVKTLIIFLPSAKHITGISTLRPRPRSAPLTSSRFDWLLTFNQRHVRRTFHTTTNHTVDLSILLGLAKRGAKRRVCPRADRKVIRLRFPCVRWVIRSHPS
jgi:hypothetical protein